jgi:hypothetical protein
MTAAAVLAPLLGVNICSKRPRRRALYPPAAKAASKICIIAGPNRLPSTSTIPATCAGARKAASSTTRQPRLWPTRTAGGKASARSSAATSVPHCSMVETSATGVAPWPGRSTAIVM